MASILLITTIYPLPSKENRGTAVCHYFAREWLKMGHNVRVVHFQAVYPALFYWVARLNQKKIAAKSGAIVYTSRDKGGFYEMDGVQVNRIPLFKPIPHGRFSARAIRKSIERIISWNKDIGFVPDVITGHFPNPQIEVVGNLKESYPKATTAIVMHGDIELTKKVYGERLIPLAKRIDLWGFRSIPLRNSFERRIMSVDHPFICYSGIPEDYITTDNTHCFDAPVRRFLYVGEMIERKKPLAVMDALQNAYPDGEYDLTYVGTGQLLSEIQKRVDSECLQNRVHSLGSIPRNSIKDQYDAADCMIMISHGEAYGLVYLEAMARGCITIASRNEGFDGIIKDGVNGFLCKAGDVAELSSIILRIKQLNRDELVKISDAAIETAKWLTDANAARLYLDELMKSHGV